MIQRSLEKRLERTWHGVRESILMGKDTVMCVEENNECRVSCQIKRETEY